MSLTDPEAAVIAALIGAMALFVVSFVKDRKRKPTRARRVRDDWQQWAKESQATMLAVYAQQIALLNQQLADRDAVVTRQQKIIEGFLTDLRRRDTSDEWRRIDPPPDGEGTAG